MAINVIVWRAYKENHVHLIGKATFKDQHNQHPTFFVLFSSFPRCAAPGDLIVLGGKIVFSFKSFKN
jgi:hypothetical protein